MPKTVVHVDHLEPDQARHYSRMQLRTMVRRLLSAGMNSEEVKTWFVEQLPLALTHAANLGLRPRRRRAHTVAAQQATPNMNAQEC